MWAKFHVSDTLRVAEIGIDRRPVTSQIETLDGAVLRAGYQQIGFRAMKGHRVGRSFVLVVHQELLLTAKLGEIPHRDHSVGGRRGQDVRIERTPRHIVGRVAEILILPPAHIANLREAIIFDGEHFQQTATGHGNLRAFPVQREGICVPILADANRTRPFLVH